MCENPKPRGSQPANRLVIRFVKMMLIFASHRFRNRTMRTHEAAMTMTRMAPVLTVLLRVSLRKESATGRRNPDHATSVHVLPDDETAIIRLLPDR